MYNLQDIIFEKYTEGVIDDEHFLSLYEAADEYDDMAKLVKGTIEARQRGTRNAAIGTAIGAAALGVVGTKVNKEANKEVVDAFKSAKESYKKNIKEAKQYIKTGDKVRAKRNISDAIKDIEECEKIVKDADVNVLQWLAQYWATNMKEFWSSVALGTAIGILSGDPNEAGAASATIFAAMKIVKLYKMFKYNNDVEGLGKMLNSQRANMLSHLDQCKKYLKKLESKISK